MRLPRPAKRWRWRDETVRYSHSQRQRRGDVLGARERGPQSPAPVAGGFVMGDLGTAIIIIVMSLSLSVIWSGILWASGFGSSIFHVLRWINLGVTLFVGHAFIEASAGHHFSNFAI